MTVMVAAAPENQCSCNPAAKVDWSALMPENGVGFAEIQFQASPPLTAGMPPSGMLSSYQTESVALLKAMVAYTATKVAISAHPRATMSFFMGPRV